MDEAFDFHQLQEQLIYEVYVIETRNQNLELNQENILEYLPVKMPSKFVRQTLKKLNDRGFIEFVDSDLVEYNQSRINISADGLEYVEENRKDENSIIFAYRLEKITEDAISEPNDGLLKESQYREGPVDKKTLDAIDELAAAMADNNEYRSLHPEDVDREIAQIEAGRRLLEERQIDLTLVEAVLVNTVKNIASKAIETAVGKLADHLLTLLIVLVANA